MTPDTSARRKLAEWLDKPEGAWSQREMADALGISQPCVANWLRKNSRPDLTIRLALQILTGGAVPASEWVAPSERAEERRRVERVERALAKRTAA